MTAQGPSFITANYIYNILQHYFIGRCNTTHNSQESGNNNKGGRLTTHNIIIPIYIR